MKIRIYWILYPLYVFFVYWAFKYEMVEKYRTFFGSCFLLVPIVLELIRKFENKNNSTTKWKEIILCLLMKLWNNLSKEQKRMAKIAIFNTLMMSIIMVIIKPIVKGEAFVVTDKLIEFLIYVVVLFAFNCIFIIGARTPKGK